MRLSDFDKAPENDLTTAPAHTEASEMPGDVAGANGAGAAIPQIQATETANPKPGVISVLKNRNFVTLWSGQIFSQLADKVIVVLMIAIVESQFQSENQSISGWVSAILIANTIPAVLFGSLEIGRAHV